MAKSQFDFLDEEKVSISEMLSGCGTLRLMENRVDPYTPTNIFIIGDAKRRLQIEITHKHPREFCGTVLRHAIRHFAAGDLNLCRLTC